MPPKSTNGNTTTNTSPLCSVSSLFLSFSLLSTLSLLLFLVFNTSSTHHPNDPSSSLPSSLSRLAPRPDTSIKVYVADLPRSLNYGLLDKYWSFHADSRLGSDADRQIRATQIHKKLKFPPFPENPIIKQYSAEYWIMGDLMNPEELRTGSFAKRVFDVNEADVVFVPFFATMSAEMQLGMSKGTFRKKVGNEDFDRQRQVLDFVQNTEAWKRSGGRDHVFVLTGIF